MRLPPALRYPKFTLLWAGLLISIAGSQMQVAALHWHVRELTGVPDPMALGLIGLARIVPVILFSLFGGALADSFDRRKILLVSQTAMALTAAALAWLTFTEQIQLWHIYALTALQAAAIAFDGPARQAIVPNLVPAEDLPSAFSLNSIAFNAGAVIGPVMSGVVIASLGQGYTYAINAVSFLAVIAAVLVIGSVPQNLRAGSGVNLAAIREGVRFILTRRIIFSTMVMDFFATFFASANTLLPIVARDILQVGEVGYGWLAAAQSIGSVTAGLVISQLSGLRRQGPLFLTAVGIFGAATIFFGLANSFWFAYAALLVIGAADTVSTIIRNTIRQLQTPDEIRGRMTSINQIFFQGGPQLGEVEAGLAASLWGVPFALISGGAGTLVAAALIARKWPELWRYDA